MAESIVLQMYLFKLFSFILAGKNQAVMGKMKDDELLANKDTWVTIIKYF